MNYNNYVKYKIKIYKNFDMINDNEKKISIYKKTLTNEQFNILNNNIFNINYIDIDLIKINNRIKYQKYINNYNIDEATENYKINYIFDYIYIISLKKNNEKRDRCMKQLLKYNINNYEFFDAINTVTSNKYNILYDEVIKHFDVNFITYNFPRGALGCLLSHLKILLDAKEKKYNSILILEDDFVLKNNFEQEYLRIVPYIPENWDFIYFGKKQGYNCEVNEIFKDKYDSKCYNTKHINDEVYTPNYITWATHAICIKNTIFDDLINEYNILKSPVDLIIMNIYHKFNFYVLYNDLFITSFDSDIRTCDEENELKLWNWNKEEYFNFNNLKINKIVIWNLKNINILIINNYFNFFKKYFTNIEVLCITELKQINYINYENTLFFCIPSNYDLIYLPINNSSLYIFYLDNYKNINLNNNTNLNNIIKINIEEFFKIPFYNNIINSNRGIILLTKEKIMDLNYFEYNYNLNIVCLPILDEVQYYVVIEEIINFLQIIFLRNNNFFSLNPNYTYKTYSLLFSNTKLYNDYVIIDEINSLEIINYRKNNYIIKDNKYNHYLLNKIINYLDYDIIIDNNYNSKHEIINYCVKNNKLYKIKNPLKIFCLISSQKAGSTTIIDYIQKTSNKVLSICDIFNDYNNSYDIINKNGILYGHPIKILDKTLSNIDEYIQQFIDIADKNNYECLIFKFAVDFTYKDFINNFNKINTIIQQIKLYNLIYLDRNDYEIYEQYINSSDIIISQFYNFLKNKNYFMDYLLNFKNIKYLNYNFLKLNDHKFNIDYINNILNIFYFTEIKYLIYDYYYENYNIFIKKQNKITNNLLKINFDTVWNNILTDYKFKELNFVIFNNLYKDSNSTWDIFVNALSNHMDNNLTINYEFNNINKNTIVFFDFIDREFGWDYWKTKKKYPNGLPFNWGGIIHHPFKLLQPYYHKTFSVSNYLNFPYVKECLKTCKFLIVLSDQLKNEINNSQLLKDYDIQIYVIYHIMPIPEIKTEVFDLTSIKYLTFSGWSFRNYSLFVKINTNSLQKIILPGAKDGQYERFLNVLNIHSNNKNINDITIQKFSSYDNFLYIIKNSIMFIDFDGISANNTILECIKYNIPIIVRNLEATRFYLGSNYPLYYDNEEDINNIFNNIYKIEEAYNYLKNLNKSKFTLPYNIFSTLEIIEKYNCNLNI